MITNFLKNEAFGVYWKNEADEGKNGENSGPGQYIRPMEVCFNTTELTRGLSFRFQASNADRPQAKIGNEYIYLNTYTPQHLETIKKIRLGDILAGSSCFPGGFEPILFPKDFARTGDGSLSEEKLRQACHMEKYDRSATEPANSFGIMDGGIDDNQGVYSSILADYRRRKLDINNGFDLFFITDVASYFMDPYEAIKPMATEGLRKETISNFVDGAKGYLDSAKLITRISIILSTILFLASSTTFFLSVEHSVKNVCLVCSTFFGTILIAAIFFHTLVIKGKTVKKISSYLALSNIQLVENIKQTIPSIKNFSDDTVRLLLEYLQKTPLGNLDQMIRARLNSTLSIVMDVNLKQTRRLIFNIFYGNFYGQDVWENRRVFNVIYELSLMNIKSRAELLRKKFNKKAYEIGPDSAENQEWSNSCIRLLTEKCEGLNTVAEDARTMGTTLWYDNTDTDSGRVKKIIACGQFTTCAKLLEYALVVERIIEKQRSDSSIKKTVDIDVEQLDRFMTILQKLKSDWQDFKMTRFF